MGSIGVPCQKRYCFPEIHNLVKGEVRDMAPRMLEFSYEDIGIVDSDASDDMVEPEDL